MDQPEVITVKIPKALKRKMKQIDMNWSQYIRDCVEKKVNQETMIEAFKKLDEIRKRSKPVTNDEVLSWIEEGRE